MIGQSMGFRWSIILLFYTQFIWALEGFPQGAFPELTDMPAAETAGTTNHENELILQGDKDMADKRPWRPYVFEFTWRTIRFHLCNPRIILEYLLPGTAFYY